MTEEWRPVLGYDGYEVSNQGRVRSLDRLVRVCGNGQRLRRGRVLKQTATKHGHQSVTLSQHSVIRPRLVHVLVLEAFVGPRPEGLQGCHWNDVPDDNRVENLRWGTHSDNMRDCVRNERHVNAMKTHCPQRHEYTPENTYLNPAGSRRCRTCKRAQRRKKVSA